MCYSAQVEMDLKVLAATEKAVVDLAAFEACFEARLSATREDVPKALEWNYNVPVTPHERRMRELIESYRERRKAEHEEGILVQKEKLADAQRRFAKKPSPTSTKQIEVATRRIGWHEFKMADQLRVERKDRDQYIYPQWYAPVIYQEGSERIIRPMRYLCHPHNRGNAFPGKKNGKDAILTFDEKYAGCYNARRDNLRYFWKGVFGEAHAYMIITSFFENVPIYKFEKRPPAPGETEDDIVVIHFNPQPKIRMKVACIWSIWKSEGKPDVGSSRVDLQACKLEYSIVSPK